MRIAAYQFAVTGDVERNLAAVESAVARAAAQGVRLLLLPECALTGYPPRDLPGAASVDFERLRRCHGRLQALAAGRDMYIVAGTITRRGDRCFDSAVVFAPNPARTAAYHKRALWGWDRDNFCEGREPGVLEIDGLRVGVRICFEVRFPEYFRELYRANTVLNLLLFYDVSDVDGEARYDLIRAHVRTRAVENACPILCANAVAPFQTAPTLLADGSGRILREAERNAEALIVCDWAPMPLSFGEQGRRTISDRLLGM